MGTTSTGFSVATWPDVGLPGVRALFAEGVAGEFAEKNAPGQARWHGGQRKGYDVRIIDGLRYDAKSVKVEKGEVVLARWNAVPYDPDKVDMLVLVQLEDTHTDVGIDLSAGTAVLHGTARIVAAWVVRVAELNALMEAHSDSGPNTRNVHLAMADLADYRQL